MRTRTTLLTAAMAAFAFHPSHAQWGTDIVNNAINWELQVWESEYTGSQDDDGFADPTIKTECFVNGATLGSGCKTWDCDPPCTNSSQGPWWSGIGTPYAASLALYGVAFESDGADDCVYEESNGDHYWAGYLTLRDGLADMPIIYPSPDFAPCQWNPWLASGTTWLMPSTEQFDQRMRLAWRYAAGWGPEAPLDLGTVAMGATKRDVNSTAPVTGQYSSAGLQYANVEDQGVSTAPDVYYTFHIDQPSTVTISTDDALTDFNTMLYLYSLPGGVVIGTDDEGGVLPGTSTIVRQVCAGDYRVRVTGYQAESGLFRLIVMTQAPSVPYVDVYNLSGVSCPEASDGVAYFYTGSGVTPAHYWVNGNDIGTGYWVSDLAMGDYLVESIDACGRTSSESFSVVNADVTAPSAICETTLNIDVIEGQNTGLLPAEVDNGSSDNCGDVTLSVSPNLFSTSDVGLQSATLTVTDGNANVSTCTCLINVMDATGIAETGMASRIRVLPNPSNGHFQLDLSNLSLSTHTRMEIHDALGRAVFSTNLSKATMDLDLGHLPSGTYMLRLNDPQWDAVKRIVIQH